MCFFLKLAKKLPLKQIYPFPSLFGLSIEMVRPSMTLPASRRNSLSLKFFHLSGLVNVYGPESSLMPKQFIKKKFKFMKNARVDSRIGAAEKTNTSHLSNPKFFFILLKINFLAILQPKGVGQPFTYA
jgi:hypothetical protein